MESVNNLKFLQWNCRGILNKQSEFLLLLDESVCDIELVCETLLNDTHSVDFKNYATIPQDRINSDKTKGGGVMININKKIPFKVYKDIYYKANVIETVAIKIPINSNSLNDSITVVCYYRPPGSIMSKNDWLKFFGSLPKNSFYVIGVMLTATVQYGTEVTNVLVLILALHANQELIFCRQ